MRTLKLYVEICTSSVINVKLKLVVIKSVKRDIFHGFIKTGKQKKNVKRHHLLDMVMQINDLL